MNKCVGIKCFLFLFICIEVIILILFYNLHNPETIESNILLTESLHSLGQHKPESIERMSKLIALVRSKNKRVAHLKHIIASFEAYNAEINYLDLNDLPEQEWNILWSYEFPNAKFTTHIKSMKRKVCINHYPGTRYISVKDYLAKSESPFIPKAFKIPEDKSSFLKFAQDNPNYKFVKKSKSHRGVEIKTLKEIDFTSKGSFFVQHFLQDTLLVDGYKFDIGVYTVITSSDPLRVYIHEDVLFRFCKKKLHPFDANDTKKYVVGDDYRPIWEMPSLQNFYKKEKLGMKATFNAWLKDQGKDPEILWNRVEEAIRSILQSNERNFKKDVRSFPDHIRYFELLRFDFLIDEELNVYLMEVNMSPNLSSAHFAANSLLYEQVVFNLLGLIGVAYGGCSPLSSQRQEMMCSERDLSVFPNHCASSCSLGKDSCGNPNCQLCPSCIDIRTSNSLRLAFLEHMYKGSFHRVMPKPMTREEASQPVDSTKLSDGDTLMAEWFRGKCLDNPSFCS